MLKTTIPPTQGVLFEATLEPIALAVSKLTKDARVDEGEINIFRGKKNKAAVGLPYYENLSSRLKNLKEKIPYEIEKLTNDFDFHYVRLTCSFLSDKDCRFDWARLVVELNGKLRNGETVQAKPIAWDISPNDVSSEIRCKREFTFTPELKFSIIPEVLDAGVHGGVSESKEYVVYEPQITSFGLNGSKVAWDFRRTKEKGIWGDKSLLLVVRTTKGSRVNGRFLIGAEVTSHLSKWIPIPVSERKDGIVDKVYDLSE
jgi:hypothetical protein